MNELIVQLGYDRATMKPIGIDVGGALLADWMLTLTDDTATSTLSVQAVAKAGVTLAGPGRLLSFRFLTYLSSSFSSTLPLALVIPGNTCSVITRNFRQLTLEICGLQQRLIELDSSQLLLRQNHPNPFNPTTRIVPSQ